MAPHRARHAVPRRRRRSADSRSHAATAFLLVGVLAAAVLAVNALLGPDPGGPGPPAPDPYAQTGTRSSPTGTTTGEPTGQPPASAPVSTVLANRLANGGFTRDLNGWSPSPATFASWQPDGRSGPGAVVLRRNMRLPGDTASFTASVVTSLTGHDVVTAAPKGAELVASVWVRASRPGTTVAVRISERQGRREVGGDHALRTLNDGGWQQLQVRHVVATPGVAVDLQVAAVGLAADAIVIADDATLSARGI